MTRPLASPDPTSELLARLAGGDRSASDALFRALWGPVRRLAGAMLPNAADADDAAQDAVMTIFQRVTDFDPARPGLPWALAITAWSCRTIRKRRSRRREAPEAAAPDRLAVDAPDETAERQELAAAAAAALEHLAPVDRETLLAAFWEEEAEVGGATFRKRKERALGRLRDFFRRTYGLG